VWVGQPVLVVSAEETKWGEGEEAVEEKEGVGEEEIGLVVLPPTPIAADAFGSRCPAPSAANCQAGGRVRALWNASEPDCCCDVAADDSGNDDDDGDGDDAAALAK